MSDDRALSLAAALVTADVVALGAVRAGALVYASPALARMLGIAGTASARAFSDFVAESDRDRVARALSSTVATSLAFRGVRADGSLFEAQLSASLAELPDGLAMAFAMHDASRAEADPRQLSYAALHDSASGLPNRKRYFDRAEQAVIAAGRSQRKVGAMAIELTAVDDSGRSVSPADKLLRDACARLQACLRETDTIARLGENLLGVLLPRLGTREHAAEAAARMAASLAEPFETEGRRLRIALRFGVASYPDDAPTPEQLVERAEAALREAGHGGEEPIALASPLPTASAPARVQWSERYEVGIEVIDGQHRQLLELINRLGDDLSAGRDFDQLVESLKALVRYTEHHFATEERLMDEVGAGAERHRAEHRRLEESLARLTLPLDAAGVSQSSRFLQDWLFRHIDEVDRPFAAFLRAQGIG